MEKQKITLIQSDGIPRKLLVDGVEISNIKELSINTTEITKSTLTVKLFIDELEIREGEKVKYE